MYSIHDRLKNLREKHDFKQKYIADYLNISQQSYSRYESGKHEIPIRYLISLSKLYNISTDYLLGLSVDESVISSISEFMYAGKCLKDIIDDINALNNKNISHLINYIEFLKSEQNKDR